MVDKDEETSKDKEIYKLIALISLSFKKIYKPTNNNLRTSLNTSRANQDNSPRINRNAGYENQRIGNVVGARENVARECHKPKRAKDAAYHREKMLLCKQEEAGIQLNAEQADWRDDTDDDELEDQELEAHYMYMVQLREVSPDAANSGPVFGDEPLQKVSTDDHYNVFAMESTHCEQSKFVHDTYPIEQDAQNVIIDSLDMSDDKEEIDHNDDDNDLAKERELLASLIEKLKCEIDESKNRNKFLETSNKTLIKKLKAELARRNSTEYASQMELECAKVRAPDTDEVIRLEKESRSKLSDLIRPFDYDKLNNLYDLFVPQREKSCEQRYFSERSRLSHINVNNGKSKESFNKQTTLLEKRIDESISIDKQCQSSLEIFKVKSRISAGLNQFHRCLNEEMAADLRYFNSLEVDSLRSQLETQKTQFLNEIDRLSREYYYADHMNAILSVYTELDEVTNLQCDYLELLKNCEGLEIELSKSKIMSKSFESVQKHAINIELELQQCKEKIKNDMLFNVNKTKYFCKEQTKFEKSSVIRQPNAFKSQRPSVLGKPTTFSNSFVRKDFSKSTSVSQTHVSNDFSKTVTAQTLPLNKKSILKNTNVLAPGMYKLHTDHTQTRTSQLPQDSRKTNKRVSFSTGVIPTTSVSRPQLKSNPQGDRVMHNNSQGKKQEVEDHSQETGR
nr:hypothetical protein [Tanacetum cinerariifolium]